MDSMEKVLNSLIDSMHAKIASGHGKKVVDPKEEMEKASEEKAEPMKKQVSEGELPEGLFEKWLASEKSKKPVNNKASIVVTSKAPVIQSSKKSKK